MSTLPARRDDLGHIVIDGRDVGGVDDVDMCSMTHGLDVVGDVVHVRGGPTREKHLGALGGKLGRDRGAQRTTRSEDECVLPHQHP